MLGSTPSDAAQGLYSLYTLGYKSWRDRRKKKKARRRRRRMLAEAKRVRVENLLGQWNKSHSPLASKRSFFVPNVYSSHNPLRSFINHGR